MRGAAAVFALLVAGALLAGGSCGGGDGSGGRAAVVKIESLDPRGAALGGTFPPGFDFLTGTEPRAVVANLVPPSLITFRIDGEAPAVDPATPILTLPDDSDGDGVEEGSGFLPFRPQLDGVFTASPALAAAGLGLATASSYEEVIFFDPGAGALRRLDVRVPASFAAADNPFLPAPGTTAGRTALSTFACVRPGPDALDSRGDRLADVLPPAAYCDPAEPSYLSTFTSGVTYAAGRLFVSTSNLGDDAGTADAQFLPGSVLVYDLDLAASPPVVAPHPDRPAIVTTAFNPTQVTALEVGDRAFVLVTLTGALGIAEDDPDTREIEAGGVPITDGAIDVIDAETLELVATYPLGRASPSFDRLAIDPSGRVAATGSAADRILVAVDLAPLASLPDRVGEPVRLDDAVIFDADAPLRIPALPGGAPPASCPGFVVGAAFGDFGDRIFATEFCDGTLATVDVDLSDDPPVPVPASRFVVAEVEPLVAPLRPDSLGEPRAPGAIATRPGIGTGGPEIFFFVGQPEGSFCAIPME